MTLSEEEIDMYRRTFDSFDLDQNGTISAEELGLGLHELGMDRHQASIKRMIDEVDTDKDHELNFDEFLVLIQSPKLVGLFEKEVKQDLIRQQSVRGLENIYGQTHTPPETKESVKLSLEQLQVELGKIGDKKKDGYNQALKKCPDLINDDFFLMFLRTEVFHARRAAERLVTYWNKRIEVFGEEKAFMRLTLDEALADDSVALSQGIMYPAGSDSSGRGLLFIDNTREGKAEYTSMSLCRAVWYFLHVALEDEKAQKLGLVLIVKTVDSLAGGDVPLCRMLASHLRGALPMRFGCMHICHAKPFVNVIVKIVRLMFGKKLRNRIRVHGGANDMVLQEMAEYGIPDTAIPDIWGGELEYDDHGQKWLENRREKEVGQK